VVIGGLSLICVCRASLPSPPVTLEEKVTPSRDSGLPKCGYN
jgi:hypothetical protein